MSVEMEKHSIALMEPKREIEAILFDMDGVLADSIPAHSTAWNSASGVVEWLDFFKRKQILCSGASSGDMANIVIVLDTLQVSGYFTSIISGALLPASKPDPLIFKLAAASLGADTEKCLVIEDAPAGIQAAKSANMVCCAIATSLSRDYLNQADILLNDLSQVSPDTLFSDSNLPI